MTIRYPQKLDENERLPLLEMIKSRMQKEVVSDAKYQKEIFEIASEDDLVKIKCGRYDSFITLLYILTELNFSIEKIEGNDFIQVRIKDNAFANGHDGAINKLCHDGVSKHYQYQNSIDNQATFFSLDVPVRQVPDLLKEIQEDERLSLHWVHDF